MLYRSMVLAVFGMFAATGMTPAKAGDFYPYLCAIGSGKGEAHRYVAITESFESDLGNDEVTYQMNSFLYDVMKGRVQVPFDASGNLTAYCMAGSPDVRRNFESFYRARGQIMTLIKSPLDARGRYRRNSAAGTKNPPSAKVTANPTPVMPAKVAPPTPKGPTPNQLKYQRELEAYNARLAEIDKIKADTAAKHAADKAAADQQLAKHRQELALADAAKRKYQAELAAHQQRVRELETKQDRETKVDWREAVVVCEKRPGDGQSNYGNWRCDGPLQMTYAKLDETKRTGFGDMGDKPSVALSAACGTKAEAVRELGMVGSAKLFGCGFGLHPNARSNFPLDAAAKHGISYVPGRAIYRCPAYKSACRTQ